MSYIPPSDGPEQLNSLISEDKDDLNLNVDETIGNKNGATERRPFENNFHNPFDLNSYPMTNPPLIDSSMFVNFSGDSVPPMLRRRISISNGQIGQIINHEAIFDETFNGSHDNDWQRGVMDDLGLRNKGQNFQQQHPPPQPHPHSNTHPHPQPQSLPQPPLQQQHGKILQQPEPQPDVHLHQTPPSNNILKSENDNNNAPVVNPPIRQQNINHSLRNKRDSPKGIPRDLKRTFSPGSEHMQEFAGVPPPNYQLVYNNEVIYNAENGPVPGTAAWKKDRLLERNRVAASKCRQRKKQAQQQLLDDIDVLNQENEGLRDKLENYEKFFMLVQGLFEQSSDFSNLDNLDNLDLIKNLSKSKDQDELLQKLTNLNIDGFSKDFVR